MPKYGGVIEKVQIVGYDQLEQGFLKEAEQKIALRYHCEQLKQQVRELEQNLREEMWFHEEQEDALLDLIKQLEEENRRLKAVVEAVKRKRQLELERREITQKLARKVITKDYWVEHGIKHVKELEKVEAELDAALAALEEEER